MRLSLEFSEFSEDFGAIEVFCIRPVAFRPISYTYIKLWLQLSLTFKQYFLEIIKQCHSCLVWSLSHFVSRSHKQILNGEHLFRTRCILDYNTIHQADHVGLDQM